MAWEKGTLINEWAITMWMIYNKFYWIIFGKACNRWMLMMQEI